MAISNLKYWSINTAQRRQRDRKQLSIIAVIGVALITGSGFKALTAGINGDRRQLLATNVEQCVTNILPGVSRRIAGDRVILLDRKGSETKSIIGFLPGVASTHVPHTLTAKEPVLRKHCGPAAAAYLPYRNNY